MIPASHVFDQSTMAAQLTYDPVVADYRAFFSSLDWSVVERWEAQRSSRGRPAHPEVAFLTGFSIRIRQNLIYTTQLRDFLVKHPLLVIELGFHLVLDFTQPYGFDVEQTLPTRYWLGEKLHKLDRGLPQDLLAGTVHALQEEIPGLGEVVSFDVKHIYAWVQENNERAYVKDRYDKTKRLAGDPDCRLGVKSSTNKELPAGSTEENKELLWGYGSGVAAAPTPDYGDVVLAEYTQPFNEGDITYFRPLHRQAVHALNQYPTHLAADAAYDAQVASTMLPFVTVASLLSRSMLTPRPLLIPMACPSVPSACACTPLSATLIPMVILLNAIAARFSSPQPLARPAIMSSSRKARAVQRTSTTNLGAAPVFSWIAPARSSTPFITSAPLVSASIARPKNSASSAPKSEMVDPSPTSIP